MGYQEQFEKNKARLHADTTICHQNRELFKEFFDFQEYKLKRKNGLPDLDEGCYRTLLGYLHRFKTLNRWLKNKPWKDLTSQDIKRFYDDMEDGKIKNAKGHPVKDRHSYYSKILKGKPFRMIGKADLCKEILEFHTPQATGTVRYINEEAFQAIEAITSNSTHKTLLWIAWDFGENINSLLKLKKRNFRRQIDRESGDPEYTCTFNREILKRTRNAKNRTYPLP